jgi:hypothetical protein
VKHVVAAGGGLVPAVVGGEVGLHEFEFGRFAQTGGQGSPQVRLLRQVPDAGPHRVPLLQQLDDGVPGQEAGSTGHEDGPVTGSCLLDAHDGSLCVRAPSRRNPSSHLTPALWLCV